MNLVTLGFLIPVVLIMSNPAFDTTVNASLLAFLQKDSRSQESIFAALGSQGQKALADLQHAQTLDQNARGQTPSCVSKKEGEGT